MKKLIALFFVLFFALTAYSLTVNLVLNPAAGNEPLNVTLTANVNDFPENAPRIFDWDFEGDGTLDASTNTDSIIHVYSSGNYNPTVKVTNKITEQAEDSKNLKVMESGNTPPIADAGGPYNSFPGTSFDLDGTNSENQEGYNFLTFTWELTTEKGNPDCTFNGGTNTVSELVNAFPWIDKPTVTCNNSGTAKVNLIVTDSKGATDSDSTTIKITPTQNTDKINLVKMWVEPEIVKAGTDLKIWITVRNETNQIQTFDVNYQIKEDIADTNISSLPNLIEIPLNNGLPSPTIDAYKQIDFEITIPSAALEAGLKGQKNYWVYATAEATGENNTIFNKRRTIFNYYSAKKVQVPETNLTGIIITLFFSLIILKNNKR